MSSQNERQVRIVIQARTSSSRLPAKSLLPIADFPLSVLVAKRVSKSGFETIVATSDQSSDDYLSETLQRHGVDVFRGSLSNVLGRFGSATKDLAENDICVRMTADNPVPDGAFVKILVDEFIASEADYLNTAKELPYGLAAEVFSVKALRQALANADSNYDIEHVTPWIREHCHWQRSRYMLSAGDLSDVRCTLDTFEDYCKLTKIFKCAEDPVSVAHSNLVELIIENKDETVEVSEQPDNAVRDLVLGTAQLGLRYGKTNRSDKPSKAAALHLVEQAYKMGVRAFDTARGYGTSESVLGTAIEQGIIPNGLPITKLSTLTEINENSTRAEISQQVELSVYKSLHHLKLSRLPVLLLHRAEHIHVCNGQIWKVLKGLKADGLIDKLGVSLQSCTELDLALAEPEIEHLQIPFNILDDRWDAHLEAIKKPENLTIHVRSAFLQGILLSKSRSDWPAQLDDALWDSIQGKLDDLVKTTGRCDRADLCIAFLRSTDWIDGIVVGMEDLEQLDQNITLFKEKPLTSDENALVRQQFKNLPEFLLNPALW